MIWKSSSWVPWGTIQALVPSSNVRVGDLLIITVWPTLEFSYCSNIYQWNDCCVSKFGSITFVPFYQNLNIIQVIAVWDKYWLVENGLRKDTIKQPCSRAFESLRNSSVLVDPGSPKASPPAVTVIIFTWVPGTYRSLSVLTFPSPCVRVAGQFDPPLFIPPIPS